MLKALRLTFVESENGLDLDLSKASGSANTNYEHSDETRLRRPDDARERMPC